MLCSARCSERGNPPTGKQRGDLHSVTVLYLAAIPCHALFSGCARHGQANVVGGDDGSTDGDVNGWKSQPRF